MLTLDINFLIEFIKENFFKFIFFLSALFVALGEIFGFSHKIYDKLPIGKIDKRTHENTQRITDLSKNLDELEKNLDDIKTMLCQINNNISENAKQNNLNIKATFLMLQVIENDDNFSKISNYELKEVKKEIFDYFTEIVKKQGGGA